jgi:hypothetical protein
MANLKKEYGDKKGEGIFYAMENKGEIPGMNKMKGYAEGGMMKEVPEANKGMKKLPKDVRNKMGYMAEGGMVRGQKATPMPMGKPASPVMRGSFAKGGMVKSTGKLNTGIKKCGE